MGQWGNEAMTVVVRVCTSPFTIHHSGVAVRHP
jgi:hypothetical protein